MEIAALGSSTWMPCASQGVKGTDGILGKTSIFYFIMTVAA
jgi:hypothetical protein